MTYRTTRRLLRSFTRYVVFACLLAASGVRFAASAQGVPPNAATIKQIVGDAAEQELKFLHYGRPFLRYRMHTVDAKGDQIREVIQSRDGAVARLIARDNRSLTTEEDQAERERLRTLLDSPDAYAKHVKGDISGKKMAMDLIRLMPDAMIYTLVEGQLRRPNANEGEPEIVIDYAPDPAWTPPTMASTGLTGVRGRIWLDAKTHALIAIDGHIVRGINFGLGVLAHIFPGGELYLEQSEVIPGKWSYRHFTEHVTIRALMVKTIHEDEDAHAWDFAAVTSMSYQDAIRTLLQMPLPQHAPTP